MISMNSYKSTLSSHGTNLAQIRKNNSDYLMNANFVNDPTYKRVYILTKNGWKFEDAKYQFHTATSIAKDAADYYLQFRPKVHYPIGSYVIVPDDTDFDINLKPTELKNPFEQPVSERTQWWIIVGRDNANAFVRYNILKCNWEFKWIWKGEIQKCFGIVRSANSYTSGVWRDEISSSLDNLTGAWLPDIYHVYGENHKQLGLDDNRTIMHSQRFILSNNALDPKIYQTTKITDLSPQGIIKLSIKQDETFSKKDNFELGICDYYSDEGDVILKEPEPDMTIEEKTSLIKRMWLDENYELVEYPDQSFPFVCLGESFYFEVKFSNQGVIPDWRVSLIDKENRYSEEERLYYERLMKLEKYDNQIILIKPGKASSLIGKRFVLSVSDNHGEYYSSIELEVEE